MRIAIDCRLPTYQMGGISQYILHLMPALAAIDGRNHYTVLHSRKEKRDFRPEGYANWERQDIWTPCHHRLERWSLAAELLPRRYDLLHSPDFIPPQGGASRRVITIHDLNFLLFPELLTEESRRYYYEQIKWAAEQADRIAVDSHCTRRDVVHLLDIAPQKLRTIYLAANPLYLRPVDPAARMATLNRFGLRPGYLLSVGTLEPRKNLPMLLRIYARLRSEKGFREPLVLVGRKGWLFKEVFASIDELALRDFVLHLPNVADRELAHLYHGAFALAAPSLYEGFGLPALEAQHCGCVPVVSDRGSLPEIVGEEGLALPLEDEDVWVDMLARLAFDPDFAGRAAAYGYEHSQQFRWARTAGQTLALYEDTFAGD